MLLSLSHDQSRACDTGDHCIDMLQSGGIDGGDVCHRHSILVELQPPSLGFVCQHGGEGRAFSNTRV